VTTEINVDVMRGLLGKDLTMCHGVAETSAGTTLKVSTGLEKCLFCIASLNTLPGAGGGALTYHTAIKNSDQTTYPGVFDLTAVGATGTTRFNWIAIGTKN